MCRTLHIWIYICVLSYAFCTETRYCKSIWPNTYTQIRCPTINLIDKQNKLICPYINTRLETNTNGGNKKPIKIIQIAGYDDDIFDIIEDLLQIINKKILLINFYLVKDHQYHYIGKILTDVDLLPMILNKYHTVYINKNIDNRFIKTVTEYATNDYLNRNIIKRVQSILKPDRTGGKKIMIYTKEPIIIFPKNIILEDQPNICFEKINEPTKKLQQPRNIKVPSTIEPLMILKNQAMNNWISRKLFLNQEYIPAKFGKRLQPCHPDIKMHSERTLLTPSISKYKAPLNVTKLRPHVQNVNNNVSKQIQKIVWRPVPTPVLNKQQPKTKFKNKPVYIQISTLNPWLQKIVYKMLEKEFSPRPKNAYKVLLTKPNRQIIQNDSIPKIPIFTKYTIPKTYYLPKLVQPELKVPLNWWELKAIPDIAKKVPKLNLENVKESFTKEQPLKTVSQTPENFTIPIYFIVPIRRPCKEAITKHLHKYSKPSPPCLNLPVPVEEIDRKKPIKPPIDLPQVEILPNSPVDAPSIYKSIQLYQNLLPKSLISKKVALPDIKPKDNFLKILPNRTGNKPKISPIFVSPIQLTEVIPKYNQKPWKASPKKFPKPSLQLPVNPFQITSPETFKPIKNISVPIINTRSSTIYESRPISKYKQYICKTNPMPIKQFNKLVPIQIKTPICVTPSSPESEEKIHKEPTKPHSIPLCIHYTYPSVLLYRTPQKPCNKILTENKVNPTSRLQAKTHICPVKFIPPCFTSKEINIPSLTHIKPMTNYAPIKYGTTPKLIPVPCTSSKVQENGIVPKIKKQPIRVSKVPSNHEKFIPEKVVCTQKQTELNTQVIQLNKIYKTICPLKPSEKQLITPSTSIKKPELKPICKPKPLVKLWPCLPKITPIKPCQKNIQEEPFTKPISCIKICSPNTSKLTPLNLGKSDSINKPLPVGYIKGPPKLLPGTKICHTITPKAIFPTREQKICTSNLYNVQPCPSTTQKMPCIPKPIPIKYTTFENIPIPETVSVYKAKPEQVELLKSFQPIKEIVSLLAPSITYKNAIPNKNVAVKHFPIPLIKPCKQPTFEIPVEYKILCKEREFTPVEKIPCDKIPCFRTLPKMSITYPKEMLSQSKQSLSPELTHKTFIKPTILAKLLPKKPMDTLENLQAYRICKSNLPTYPKNRIISTSTRRKLPKEAIDKRYIPYSRKPYLVPVLYEKVCKVPTSKPSTNSQVKPVIKNQLVRPPCTPGNKILLPKINPKSKRIKICINEIPTVSPFYIPRVRSIGQYTPDESITQQELPCDFKIYPSKVTPTAPQPDLKYYPRPLKSIFQRKSPYKTQTQVYQPKKERIHTLPIPCMHKIPLICPAEFKSKPLKIEQSETNVINFPPNIDKSVIDSIKTSIINGKPQKICTDQITPKILLKSLPKANLFPTSPLEVKPTYIQEHKPLNTSIIPVLTSISQKKQPEMNKTFITKPISTKTLYNNVKAKIPCYKPTLTISKQPLIPVPKIHNDTLIQLEAPKQFKFASFTPSLRPYSFISPSAQPIKSEREGPFYPKLNYFKPSAKAPELISNKTQGLKPVHTEVYKTKPSYPLVKTPDILQGSMPKIRRLPKSVARENKPCSAFPSVPQILSDKATPLAKTPGTMKTENLGLAYPVYQKQKPCYPFSKTSQILSDIIRDFQKQAQSSKPVIQPCYSIPKVLQHNLPKIDIVQPDQIKPCLPTLGSSQLSDIVAKPYGFESARFLIIPVTRKPIATDLSHGLSIPTKKVTLPCASETESYGRIPLRSLDKTPAYQHFLPYPERTRLPCIPLSKYSSDTKNVPCKNKFLGKIYPNYKMVKSLAGSGMKGKLPAALQYTPWSQRHFDSNALFYPKFNKICTKSDNLYESFKNINQPKTKLDTLNNELDMKKANGITLNKIGIEPKSYEFVIETKNPEITLKAWNSKLNIIKPKIVYEVQDIDALNFEPIYYHNYTQDVVEKVAKEAITKKYGEPIVIKGSCTIDNPYAVIDNLKNITGHNAYILWLPFDNSEKTHCYCISC